MCPLTPEELRRISENNPTIRRLRERNERRKELLRKTLELKKDNEDLAWKVFCLHRKGAIHRDFIVGPILEDLVKNIGSLFISCIDHCRQNFLNRQKIMLSCN